MLFRRYRMSLRWPVRQSATDPDRRHRENRENKTGDQHVAQDIGCRAPASFVAVETSGIAKPDKVSAGGLFANLPEPDRARAGGAYNILVTGIGGTGVSCPVGLSV